MKNYSKSDIFLETNSNLTLLFIARKILKYFNGFFNWYLLIFIPKVNPNKLRTIKLNGTCANLTLFFLIYKVVHYLNDFYNLFLGNVYLKNE